MKHVDRPQVCLLRAAAHKGNTAQRDEGNCDSLCALQLLCTAQQNGVVLVPSCARLAFFSGFYHANA